MTELFGRSFTAEYKLDIIRKADEALASGGENLVGALLRREGLQLGSGHGNDACYE